MTELEQRYRRLLAWYPRDHREHKGEEMLGVLLAGAGDGTRPGKRETADLVWGAVRLHLRRIAGNDGIALRDVLAIVSLLGPVAILAGATTGLHELGWWIKAGALWEMSFYKHFPEAPVWVVWLGVAVLSLRGHRRIAAVGAWVGTATFGVVATIPYSQLWWSATDAGWVLLGAMTAIALTCSPGPRRGRELVSRKAPLIMAGTVFAVVLLGTLGYRQPVAEWQAPVAAVAGALLACGPRSRHGRRAALILLLPAMTVVLSAALGGLRSTLPGPATAAIFYGLPIALVWCASRNARRSSALHTGSQRPQPRE